jgi:hypothetical protein
VPPPSCRKGAQLPVAGQDDYGWRWGFGHGSSTDWGPRQAGSIDGVYLILLVVYASKLLLKFCRLYGLFFNRRASKQRFGRFAKADDVRKEKGGGGNVSGRCVNNRQRRDALSLLACGRVQSGYTQCCSQITGISFRVNRQECGTPA